MYSVRIGRIIVLSLLITPWVICFLHISEGHGVWENLGGSAFGNKNHHPIAKTYLKNQLSL